MPGDVKEAGEYFCCVKARKPQSAAASDGSPETSTYGVSKSLFQTLGQHELRSYIAQFWGIVEPGLILAEYCFRGLKRGLHFDGDHDAAEKIVVYSWKPKHDYEWDKDQFSGRIVEHAAIQGLVFVVLTRPFSAEEDGVFGVILRWNWVRESSVLHYAPIDYKDRYEEKLWR